MSTMTHFRDVLEGFRNADVIEVSSDSQVFAGILVHQWCFANFSTGVL